MKKQINLLLALAFFYIANATAQAPQSFNYQAIARDATGKALANQTVPVRLTLHDQSTDGSVIYTESKNITTNQFGLFTIEVGMQNAGFGAINWSTGSKYLQVELELAGNYVTMGTTQLLSVPYALFTDKAAHLDPNAKITPSQIDGSQLAPNTLLVWDGYKWVATDLTTLQTKTAGINWSTVGNAIVSTDFLGTTNNLPLVIKTNNIERMRVDSANRVIPGTTNAVDLGSSAKGWRDIYATGTYKLDGSTYLNNVGSRSTQVGKTQNTTNTGSGNTMIGDSAGAKVTTGLNNMYIGTSAGVAATTGSRNAAIGTYAGKNLTTGSENIFIGAAAGYTATTMSGLTFIGGYAGNRNTTGGNNTFIGRYSGMVNTVGSNNTFIGSSTGIKNTIGAGNTIIGSSAGSNNIGGANNVLIGYNSGRKVKYHSFNTAIGAHSLYSDSLNAYNTAIGDSALFNTQGAGNTALGNSAGLINISGSDNLFLGNNADASFDYLTNATAIGANATVSQSNSIILGNNAFVGIGTSTPSYKLEVQHGGSTGLHVTSTSSFSVVDIDAASGDAALRFQNAGVYEWNIRNRPSDNYLEIYELGGGGSRMVIQDATGNVGIGKLAVISPFAKLDIDPDSTTDGIHIGDPKDNAILNCYKSGIYTGATLAKTNSGTTTPTLSVSGNTNNGIECYSTSANGIYASTTSGSYAGYFGGSVFTTGSYLPSDEKLKNNVTNYDDALSTLAKLEVKQYNYRHDGLYEKMNFPQGQQIGIMAQNIQQALPNLVKETSVSANTLNHLNSEAPCEKIEFSAVNYTGLVPILVKAVQEQQAEMESLKKQNADLQNQINSLKNK